MHFPEDFYEYLDTYTLIDVKGGLERETFLDIWMVVVDKRVFARSWNKSERSWFTEFIKTGVGQIRYGNKIINVKGAKLPEDSAMHDLIDRAYLERFNQAENIVYAKGISQPEYRDYTMEFFCEDII